MFEFITGFITGMGWWLIIPLLIITMFIEHNERHGWAFIFTCVSLISAKVVFGLSWTVIGYCTLAYIPIGIMWSLWRWKRHCKSVVAEYKNLDDYVSDRTLNRIRKSIEFNSTSVEKIIMWVFVWPFSLIDSLIGDLIDLVEVFVRSIAKSTYKKWSEQSLAEFDEIVSDKARSESETHRNTPPEFR